MSVDTQQVSKNSKSLSPAQIEFIEYVTFHGIDEFIKSLKMIHDFALYYTDLCFDTEEKKALFDLKILWEGFERFDRVSSNEDNLASVRNSGCPKCGCNKITGDGSKAWCLNEQCDFVTTEL